jgi:hypothetical protein
VETLEEMDALASFMQRPSHSWLFTEANKYPQYFLRAPQQQKGGLPAERIIREILRHRFWMLHNSDWEHLLKQAMHLKSDVVESIWDELLEYAKREDIQYFPTIPMFCTMMTYWTKHQQAIHTEKRDNDDDDDDHNMSASSFQLAEAKLIHLCNQFRQIYSDSSFRTPYKILWNFYRTRPENRSIDDADFLNDIQSKYSISWNDHQFLKKMVDVLLPPLNVNHNKGDTQRDQKRLQQTQQTWLKFLHHMNTHTKSTSSFMQDLHSELLESFQQEGQCHDVEARAKHMDDLLVQILRRLDTPDCWYGPRKFLVWHFYQTLANHQKVSTLQILQDFLQKNSITIATWNAILADILLQIERHPQDDNMCKQVLDILQFLESNECSIQPNVVTYGFGLECFVAMSSPSPASSSTTNSSVLSPRKVTFDILDRIESSFGWSQDDLRKTYNRLIFTALNHDLDLASSLLDRMILSAAKPDGSTWIVLLKHWSKPAFGRSGAERSERILWHLRDLAMNAPEKYDPPGADCYAAAISAWRRFVVDEKCDDVLDRMTKIYQTILSCEDKRYLLSDSEALAIINSAITIGPNGRSHRKRFETGERLIDLIAETCPNVRPDGRLYRNVIHGWLKIKDARRALKSLERYIDAYRNSQQMIVSGPSPDRYIVACVLHCLIDSKMLWEATRFVEKIHYSVQRNDLNDAIDLDLLNPDVLNRVLTEWIKKTGHPKRALQVSRVLSILDSKRRHLTDDNRRQAMVNVTKTELLDSTVGAPHDSDLYNNAIVEPFENDSLTGQMQDVNYPREDNVVIESGKSTELDRTVEEQIDRRLNLRKTTDFSEKDSIMTSSHEHFLHESFSDHLAECNKVDDEQSDLSSANETLVMPSATSSDDLDEEATFKNCYDVDQTILNTNDRFDEAMFLAPKRPAEKNPKTKLYPRPRGRRPARAEAWDEQLGLWRLSTTTSAV